MLYYKMSTIKHAIPSQFLHVLSLFVFLINNKVFVHFTCIHTDFKTYILHMHRIAVTPAIGVC